MSKKPRKNEIDELARKRVINFGLEFDKLHDNEEKWSAIVMILTGFLIEEIKEANYEDCLQDITDDVLDNIERGLKFKEFLNAQIKGNA